MRPLSYKNNEDAIYALAIGRFSQLTPKEVRGFLTRFPTQKTYETNGVDNHASVISDEKSTEIHNLLSNRGANIWSEITRAIQSYDEKGIAIISYGSPYYPNGLHNISDSPPLLFVKGNPEILNHRKPVAIVGTRNPTQIGLKYTRLISENLCMDNACIVSGLAIGIDTEAHKAALESQNQSSRSVIAVMGTSIDKIYPARNRKLAEDILANSGALISELGLGEYAARGSFVRRNRIQAGVSVAIIPVQTGMSGGTIQTIRFAKKYGRYIRCPMPETEDAQNQAWEGIQELISADSSLQFSVDHSGLKELNHSIEQMSVSSKSKTLNADVANKKKAEQKQLKFPL